MCVEYIKQSLIPKKIYQDSFDGAAFEEHRVKVNIRPTMFLLSLIKLYR